MKANAVARSSVVGYSISDLWLCFASPWPLVFLIPRVRIHCLEEQLAAAKAPGLVETNAGVRSCMIEYDQRSLALPQLLQLIQKADASIGDVKVSHTYLLQAIESRCVLL
jgi:hypothetical protein